MKTPRRKSQGVGNLAGQGHNQLRPEQDRKAESTYPGPIFDTAVIIHKHYSLSALCKVTDLIISREKECCV